MIEIVTALGFSVLLVYFCIRWKPRGNVGPLGPTGFPGPMGPGTTEDTSINTRIGPPGPIGPAGSLGPLTVGPVGLRGPQIQWTSATLQIQDSSNTMISLPTANSTYKVSMIQSPVERFSASKATISTVSGPSFTINTTNTGLQTQFDIGVPPGPSGPSGPSQFPIGGIIAWPSSLVPLNFMACDGSLLSKAKYNDLYGVIQNVFGSTADSFNIPDLRSRFILGAQNIIVATGGTSTSSIQIGQHSHTITISSLHDHVQGQHQHAIDPANVDHEHKIGKIKNTAVAQGPGDEIIGVQINTNEIIPSLASFNEYKYPLLQGETLTADMTTEATLNTTNLNGSVQVDTSNVNVMTDQLPDGNTTINIIPQSYSLVYIICYQNTL